VSGSCCRSLWTSGSMSGLRDCSSSNSVGSCWKKNQNTATLFDEIKFTNS
jgi:hypothetical protein